MPRWTAGFGLALCLVGAAAEANGRFPEAQMIVAGRGTAKSTLAIRTTFGVVLHEATGFRYVCEEVVGTGGLAYDPPIGLTGDGRLLAGLWDGLARGAVDGCGSARVATLEGEAIQDLDVDPTGLLVVAVSRTGLFTGASAVFRSLDGGASFTRLAEAPETAFGTVEIAPSDLSRLWLTARTKAARSVVYRSDDGGKTLVEVTALPRPEEAYVAAVDPTNPDRVFVRLAYQDASFLTRSAAYRTDDAGKTWSLVADVPGHMLGFAIDPSGKKVFLGGPDAGLLRSLDGGAPVSISTAKVRCLRHHEGRLYACLGSSASTFGVAASCDEGATFPTIVDLPSLTNAGTCASGTTGAVCPSKLATLRAGLEAGVPPPVCATDGGTDASADTAEVAAVDAASDATADAATADTSIDAGAADTGPTQVPFERATGGGCASSPTRGGATLLALAALASAALGARRNRRA